MIGSLGAIKAKKEPAASQSPQHVGSLLAGQQGKGGEDKCSSLHLSQWLLSSEQPQKQKRQQARLRHEDKENQSLFLYICWRCRKKSKR